jgi:hypothetical protein
MAPVFCKSCSYLLSEDAVELEVYRLLFDVAELSARGARKGLIESQRQMNINHVNTMFLTTIKNIWETQMRATWSSIYLEVLIQKKENAFAEWRILIDELLETHKDYSTQPDDIKRLILGVPIEPDYVQAPTIVGDLKEKDGK